MTATHSRIRAGLAVLVGRTNVGKSTLMNRLVGRKVTIVTAKPQTTRDAIHGVVHREGGQIVFVDTPGFFQTHASKLVDTLHQRAKEALEDIDVVVHLVDPTRAPGAEDDMVKEALAATDKPRILCLNKRDIKVRPWQKAWRERAKDYAAVVDVSARTGKNLEALVRAIIRKLPKGPLLYPADEVTNASREFQVAETIREKVYKMTGQEIPYRTAVELDLLEERASTKGEPMWHVKAAIVTPTKRYQRMLIGAQGKKIEEIGTAARKELERALGQKVFLDMDVIVDKHMKT